LLVGGAAVAELDAVFRADWDRHFSGATQGILASPKLSPWLVSHAKLAAPLVEWLTFATR